jgi:hypothetical protein
MIEWILIGVLVLLALLCVTAFWGSDFRKGRKKRPPKAVLSRKPSNCDKD